MQDFTIKSFIKLIHTLRDQGFLFLTFRDFRNDNVNRVIILRQDVDLLPDNSLEFARIQSEIGISSTFYFRAVPESFDENIIREIYKLGHEIGYHYEDVGATAQRFTDSMAQRRNGAKGRSGEDFKKELVDIAIESFSENLEKLRKIAPVKTICMHGSPMSKWDSRLLWKYYDYHDFGITAEPYFDLDFEEVMYLTDTGRRWDGEAVSVRDKVSGVGRQASGEEQFANWKVKPLKYRDKPTPNPSREGNPSPKPETSNQQLEAQRRSRLSGTATFPKFHSTSDIIKAAEEGLLPDKIMMTFHPQRWTDKPLPWVKELVWQNVKNSVKYFVVRMGGQELGVRD